MSLVITVEDGKRTGDRFDDNWNKPFSNKKPQMMKWNGIKLYTVKSWIY